MIVNNDQIKEINVIMLEIFDKTRHRSVQTISGFRTTCSCTKLCMFCFFKEDTAMFSAKSVYCHRFGWGGCL